MGVLIGIIVVSLLVWFLIFMWQVEQESSEIFEQLQALLRKLKR